MGVWVDFETPGRLGLEPSNGSSKVGSQSAASSSSPSPKSIFLIFQTKQKSQQVYVVDVEFEPSSSTKN